MKRYRRGLVVGKFCPLHRGHMHVIDTALEACEELVVISYTKPEFDGCGTEVRRRWLAQLYPRVRALVVDDATLAALCRERGIAPAPLPPNDAPDAVHRAFTAWLCWEVLGVGVDAVFTSEDYGDGFAAALARDFGGRAGRPWPVAHELVDRARATVPVSGSALRRDVHGGRAFLDARVYAHFVERVCILGGESSGKTTLAQALAARLGTAFVPEAGRAYWEARGGQLAFEDMAAIAERQLAGEDRLAGHARRWLVCDGGALTSACYSALDFGRIDARLAAMARRPYAAVFVCAPDFPFVQDGSRRDAAFRARQHDWYLRALDAAGTPYTLLEGRLAARIGTACARLGAPALRDLEA